ncbi:hypothetical protein, partial [Bacteroides pyogenes]
MNKSTEAVGEDSKKQTYYKNIYSKSDEKAFSTATRCDGAGAENLASNGEPCRRLLYGTFTEQQH